MWSLSFPPSIMFRSILARVAQALRLRLRRSLRRSIHRLRRGIQRAYWQNPRRKWNHPTWRLEFFLLLATFALLAANLFA